MEDNIRLSSPQKKLGGMLGLARKAGKIIYGTDRITEYIRNKPVPIVLLASDISDNTRKRIENCCKYYKTQFSNLNMTMDTLAHFIGQKSVVSAVSVTDKGFAAAILEIIDSTTVVKRNNPQEV